MTIGSSKALLRLFPDPEAMLCCHCWCVVAPPPHYGEELGLLTQVCAVKTIRIRMAAVGRLKVLKLFSHKAWGIYASSILQVYVK